MADPVPGAFAPFRHRAFAVLWSATVLSNIGTWMHDVAAGWLMTSLSPSPLMVALVQTATTLPIFLLSLPAGALADIVDRRRLLIGAQCALAVLTGLLGLVVLSGEATPAVLLGFTFLLGTGTALIAPAWQAIVPSLVDRPALRSAIALNSAGINVSRAIGPALAGVIIATVGIYAPFFLNMVSYVGVIAALVWWRPPPGPARSLPPEHFPGALRAGLRYVRASEPMRATLVRSVAFFVFASAQWAMLPLIARDLLQGGPGLYGMLLGCVGAGAVAGALLMPRLSVKIGPNRLVALGTLGTASTLAVFSLVRDPTAVAVMCVGAGVSWIAVLSSLNVSAQTALADWVRARGLSVSVTVFFGSMSLGSLVWGQTASLFGVPTALLAAAVGAVAMIPLTWRWRLGQGEMLDLSPSLHWPVPVLAAELAHDRGPVMVTVEYRIDPERTDAFARLMQSLSDERRRDGAFAWGLFEDMAARGRFLEYFLVESWLEHQRQHQRVTRHAAVVQAQARAFHIGADAPLVHHYAAPARTTPT